MPRVDGQVRFELVDDKDRFLSINLNAVSHSARDTREQLVTKISQSACSSGWWGQKRASELLYANHGIAPYVRGNLVDPVLQYRAHLFTKRFVSLGFNADGESAPGWSATATISEFRGSPARLSKEVLCSGVAQRSLAPTVSGCDNNNAAIFVRTLRPRRTAATRRSALASTSPSLPLIATFLRWSEPKPLLDRLNFHAILDDRH
jgi:hypothetical protein